MLQLTREADYALRLMLEVATHRTGAIWTAEAARRQEIPYQFLRKVASTLVSRGFLVSKRGARGGLALARPADTITVLDIVRAIDSPALNRCTAIPPDCDRRDTCAVYPVWVQAQTEVEKVLERHLLSDLARKQLAMSAPAGASHPARRPAPRAAARRRNSS